MTNSYNGSLTREQFLFYETKVAAKLHVQGMDDDAVIAEIVADNLFQFPTERSIVSIARTCLWRLDNLSPSLVALLADSSVDVAKQVNLYAMMCCYRLVREFMQTVIGEKYRTADFDFGKKDLNVFFVTLQEQSEQVASWSDATVAKIKQVLTKSLVECGYLDSTRATKLNYVAIAPELETEICAVGDIAALPAFNCFDGGVL